jgi:hypothetical protein
MPPPIPPPTPTPSPATTPYPTKNIDDNNPTTKTTTKNGHKEITITTTLDVSSYSIIQTEKIHGQLKYIRVNNTMPIRLQVYNAQNPRHIILNTHTGLFEEYHIRHRTTDQHGNYYNNAVSHIILNYPLIIQVYGSPNQKSEITIGVETP